MKSLMKAFDILEYVALQDGRPVTSSEVTESVGLNLATASRIMVEMAGRGYLEKVSRKSGYRPGPMIAAIANRDNVYHRMAQAALNPVTELAAQIGMPVNLAVMNGTRRIMLFYHNTAPQWKPWSKLTFTDAENTATGRLLAATLPEQEAAELFPQMPLPFWPEVKDYAQLHRELAKIRKNGFVSFISEPDGTLVMGHLVMSKGYPAAAIGFGIRDEARAGEIQRLSADTAARIVQKLEHENKIY